jgi:hypothetical protein
MRTLSPCARTALRATELSGNCGVAPTESILDRGDTGGTLMGATTLGRSRMPAMWPHARSGKLSAHQILQAGTLY